MKKLLLLLLTIVSLQAKSQFINLPDSNFRNALKIWDPRLINNLGQLDTTLASTFIQIHLSGVNESNLLQLRSIKGIKYFKNLQSLSINYSLIDTLAELPNSITSISMLYNPNLSFIDKFPINTSFGQVVIDGGKMKKLPTISLNTGIFICTNNLLDSLPLLPNSIQILNLTGNKLRQLPTLPNSLTQLRCDYNQLDSLPSIPSTIQFIYCNNNKITKLPQLPNTSFTLECNNNLLTSLSNLQNGIGSLSCNNNLVSGNIINLPNSLRQLSCKNNMITGLPNFTNLTFLNCDSNAILQLPLNIGQANVLSCRNNLISTFPLGFGPNLLQKIFISSNRLTSFPSINENLNELDCSNNQITTIPKISTLPNSPFWYINFSRNNINHINGNYLPSELNYLDISHNPILSIDSLPNQITNLNCNFNSNFSLKKLPDSLKEFQLINSRILCLPNLPKVLQKLYLDSTSQVCLPNLPINFSTFKSNNIDSFTYYTNTVLSGIPKFTPKLCNPTNNVNNCASFPNIVGTVYVDENSNNSKDPNEPFRANVPVRLKANNKTVTNINGAYTLMADSIGGQTLTVTAPRFYTAIPSTINFNFNKYDTLVNVPPIALQKTISKDSLAIKITPINWAARPGFAYPFLVQYENVGSNTVNANINISFNSNALNYDSSSTTVNATTGNIQLLTNSFTPGSQGGFISYFKVKPSASLLGTNLKTWATIAGGAATAADTTNRIIGGSYDPNDKLSTPRLSTTQVAEGEFINYTVRFQNTGTDTAFTVVIADTLSSLLQTNTFEMLGSSHTCKTIIQDNKIYFEFRNILLPDSTTNLIGSNGFVNFRIKPISSVVLNTIIPNKAAIYFDYNEPIITNTATTTISNIVLPNKLISFNAALQTNKNVLLFWTTTNEVNMKEYIVEESADGVNFKTLSTELARNQNNNSYYNSKALQNQKGNYYFRLKMLGNDGAITYSNIIKINLDGSAQALHVVTNPVKDKLYINVISSKLQNTQAQLVKNSGKLVKTIILKLGNQAIDIASLSAGVYYLKTIEGVEKIVISQ